MTGQSRRRKQKPSPHSKPGIQRWVAGLTLLASFPAFYVLRWNGSDVHLGELLISLVGTGLGALVLLGDDSEFKELIRCLLRYRQ